MLFRVALALSLVACSGASDGPDESRQGGDTTVDDRTNTAFAHPAANLTLDEQAKFTLGTSPFNFVWEIPQLGPVYNNDSCLGCHVGFGRGLPQIGATGIVDLNGPQSEALVRVSLPDGTPEVPGGPVAVPGYGTQLQDHATNGVAEASLALTWTETPAMFADGETLSLRTPHLAIRDGNGDPIPLDMRTSLRTAPPMIGLGLLESVDAGALADPDDRDGDGISGSLNDVWNPETHQTERGRFGWKANTPTLHVQAASAATNDMGLSSYIFPETNGNNDIQDDQMEGIAFMISAIAVPAAAPRDAAAARGRELFDQFHCSSCHVPTLVTGTGPIPELSNQTIHPYTDLLLHDMGDLLTDARPDFAAQGVEWRTPALWGLGIASTIRHGVSFLHDGRARSYAEAIMWHGGEAQASRDAFQAASKADRGALASFLDTL
ncbi:di-heme oxidoredictase family protein [soil metagenome]